MDTTLRGESYVDTSGKIKYCKIIFQIYVIWFHIFCEELFAAVKRLTVKCRQALVKASCYLYEPNQYNITMRVYL